LDEEKRSVFADSGPEEAVGSYGGGPGTFKSKVLTGEEVEKGGESKRTATKKNFLKHVSCARKKEPGKPCAAGLQKKKRRK